MNNYKDLFNEIVVTADDVVFWLDHVAKMKGRTNSARLNYYKNFDVASKIAKAKLDGSFYKLLEDHQSDLVYSEQPTLIMTTYKEESSNEIKPCPDTLHDCNVRGCKVRSKRLRQLRNQRYYDKKMGYIR